MSTRDASEGPGALPLADYDQLSAGELEHRIRSLSAEELETLLRHEGGHADRTPVTELLRGRLAQLRAGATPSAGPQDPGARPRGPGHGEGARKGSPVGPETAGRPVHPPPHGTSDQYGKPKGDQRP